MSARALDMRGELIHFPEDWRKMAVVGNGRHIVVEREYAIVNAALSPNADVLAVSGEHSVELYSVEDGHLLRMLFDSSKGVGAFAFSPDGSLIAVGEVGWGGGRYSRPPSANDDERPTGPVISVGARNVRCGGRRRSDRD
jgi:hypothetical protein